MIPDDVLQQIRFVASYVERHTENWLTIKRELVNSLPWEYRLLFSRRHEQTKKQIVNDFEKEVMELWFGLTGVHPHIPKDMLHDPNTVVKKPGWALPKRRKKPNNEL